MPGGSFVGSNTSASTRSWSSCRRSSDEPPDGDGGRPRPALRQVVGRVARLGELEDEVPGDRPARDALLDLAEQVLRRQQPSPSGVIAALAGERHPAVAKRLPRAVGVDEEVGVQAVEAARSRSSGVAAPRIASTPSSTDGCGSDEARGAAGWAARPAAPARAAEAGEVVGLRAGKSVMFSAAHSDVSPDGSAKRTPRPRTALRSDSAYGLPSPFERRTVTGIASPCMCSAVVSAAASGLAVKSPRNATPRPCARRKPGT